jgi:Kef-type K+ transport system membrane component KefB
MSAPEMSAAAQFFLQMFVILAACRVMGWLAKRVGQPQVVGEMIAGVLLGPSLFGLVLPDWQQRLFPAESRDVLHVAAQLGIALYMFLVGLDTRTELVVRRIRGAAAVSISGIVVPFTLGVALALWFTTLPGLFSPEARTFEACVFLGASMAITAFPVLARILDERKLTGTPLGSLTLAAGAVDDAAAWCALAVVLASFGGGPGVAVKAIAGGLLYSVLLLTVGRRLLARLGTAAERSGGVTPAILGVTLLVLMLGAWAMDTAGLHAVFGGYVLGVAMPRGVFAKEMRAQLEPFAVVALLPIFFTFSGLTTRLDLVVDNLQMGGVLVAVLAVACFGKGVACWAAARWAGEDNRTAMAVGTLMNARGVMELILLNIGLQHGLILPALFSVLVVMAVVTTFMATPLFELVYGRHARASGHFGETRG